MSVMARKETLELLIEGGKASPGPASAPKLSALKMNVGEIFKEVNAKTKEYAGMQIPVKVVMDPSDKSFEVVVGTPPVSSLIKKEMGIKLMKGAHMIDAKKAEAGAAPTAAAPAEGAAEGAAAAPAAPAAEKEKVAMEILGDIKMDKLVKIAKMKQPALFCRSMKACVKQVVGTCASMPITVEGKKPKQVIKEIEEGKYDSLIQ